MRIRLQMNDNFSPIAQGFKARDVFARAWRDLEDEFGSALWFVSKPVLFLGLLSMAAYFLMAYVIGTFALGFAVLALVLGIVASTIEIKKKILGIPRERSVLASLTTFEFWVYTFVAMGATMTYFAAAAVPISVVTSLAGLAFENFGGIVTLPGVPATELAGQKRLEAFAMGLAVVVFAMILGVLAGFVAWARLGLLTTFVVDGRMPSYRATWKMLSGHTWVVFRVLILCNLPAFAITAFFRTIASLTDPDIIKSLGIVLVIVLVSLAQSLLSSAAVARIYLLVKDSRNSLLPEKRQAYMSKYAYRKGGTGTA